MKLRKMFNWFTQLFKSNTKRSTNISTPVKPKAVKPFSPPVEEHVKKLRKLYNKHFVRRFVNA